jgi:hypothetical protein
VATLVATFCIFREQGDLVPQIGAPPIVHPDLAGPPRAFLGYIFAPYGMWKHHRARFPKSSQPDRK